VLTVTGPTMVNPLLRHIRPGGRITSIARWEGIVIDPIGAVLASWFSRSLMSYRTHISAKHWPKASSACRRLL